MRFFRFAVAAVMLAASVPAYGYQNGDFQIWHTEGQDVKLKQGTMLTAEEEFHYGNNASELYYQHYDLGLAYDVNKYLTTSINYRQIYEGEKWKFKPEFQPNLNITPKCEVYGLKIEDRNRFELKLFDDNREDKVEYRNKLAIKAPLKIKSFTLEPYISDEIFVYLNTVWFRRNRLVAGISFDLVKNVKGDVYYMLQDTKKLGRWTTANILGLKLKVVF